jgi:hypothetical protein
MPRGKHMAQILSFRTPEFRTSEGTAPRKGYSAEVILFPGIRYERWSESDATKSATATSDQRRTSHDVLELAE